MFRAIFLHTHLPPLQVTSGRFMGEYEDLAFQDCLHKMVTGRKKKKEINKHIVSLISPNVICSENRRHDKVAL